MTNYTGTTLEEVLQKAAEEKNCNAEDLSYTVTEQTEDSVSADVF
ncbi:MAG: Jag N-terminal domain-containing protein, partial [Bulleidia sp.]